MDAGTLGVIGASPKGLAGPLRVSRFEDFQRLAGPLEDAPRGRYFAAHAVCHGLMNGLGRVVFSGAGDAEDAAGALVRLLGGEAPAVIVMPGICHEPAQRAVVEALAAWRRDGALGGDEPPFLWLDAPDGLSAGQAAAHGTKIAGAAPFARVVWPWVPTFTPGRHVTERIPGSCVVAPLFLGSRAELRGVHQLEDEPPAEQAELLRRARCGMLVARGRRRTIRLAFPPPWQPPRAAGRTTLEERIRDALDAATADVIRGGSTGPTLWRSLERSAAGALNSFVQSGEIAGYRVRCDAETCQEGPPVVEVQLLFARRVREVLIRVAPVG